MWRFGQFHKRWGYHRSSWLPCSTNNTYCMPKVCTTGILYTLILMCPPRSWTWPIHFQSLFKGSECYLSLVKLVPLTEASKVIILCLIRNKIINNEIKVVNNKIVAFVQIAWGKLFMKIHWILQINFLKYANSKKFYFYFKRNQFALFRIFGRIFEPFSFYSIRVKVTNY